MIASLPSESYSETSEPIFIKASIKVLSAAFYGERLKCETAWIRGVVLYSVSSFWMSLSVSSNRFGRFSMKWKLVFAPFL